MVLVLFANTNFKMYSLRVLSLIQELSFNVSVSVSMSGSGAVGSGVGSYQLGVYVPLKALFLVEEGHLSLTGERNVLPSTGNFPPRGLPRSLWLG